MVAENIGVAVSRVVAQCMGARFPVAAAALPIRKLIIALLLILTLSTLLSDHQMIALYGTLDRANGLLTQIAYLLLFGCVATQIDAARSRQLLTVMVFTAVPISLFALAQAAGWQPLPLYSDARSLLTTTLGRANFTGAYLALLLPLTLTAAQLATDRGRRIGYALLFVLELLVIVLTQARAAWIAAVVALSLLFWLQHAPHWSRPKRWLTALGGVVALVTALLLILQQSIANGGSIAARWTIWQASLRLLWPRLWLGYGADTLELHFPSVYPPQLVYYQGRGVIVDRAHNWLLDHSLNYGTVATLIFLILVLFILHVAWQQLNMPVPVTTLQDNETHLENRWLAAGMAAICAQLVGNLFLFEVAATAVAFWLLLAIVTAAISEEPLQKIPVAQPPSVQNAVMVLALLVAGGAIWLGSVRPLLADVHSWRGTQAFSQGNLVAAMVEYETAVMFQPHHAAYHVALGLTAVQSGNFAQAQKAIGAAIALHPTDPVLQTHLATVYAHEAVATESPEKVRLAYNAYEQAITLAPTIALTYQQYADLALRSGDVQMALTQAQQAVDLDATDGIAFGILGWAQLQAGNLPAAQHAFEQAVRWQPDSADFHLGLATVAFQQGRFQVARQAVQQSLQHDPAYAPALTLQLQLQEDD
ncbi:MAG: tetratricopeptide repeat protein [Anaerolineae bacterium]|nr:tetratricopeptide repeat protein [Anaerolineae bacterium]